MVRKRGVGANSFCHRLAYNSGCDGLDEVVYTLDEPSGMVKESAPGLLWDQDKSGEGRKFMLRAYTLLVLAGLAESGGGYLA